MLKKTAMVLVVCTCVSVAFGAAVKITDFVISEEEPPGSDAMAIMNYVQGQDKTVVQIVISGFSETSYEVAVHSQTHAFPASSTILTDAHGHGTLHTVFNAPPGESGDWSDSDVWIGTNVSAQDQEDRDWHAVGINGG